MPHASGPAALRRGIVRRALFGCAVATVFTFSALAAPAAQAAGRYGHISAVDGSASLFPANATTRTAVEPNYPLVTGDRLVVDRGGHVELILPDGNLLRVDGDSEVIFPNLANTPEDTTGESQIDLRAGNVQLVVTNERSVDTPPRVDTVNATVYPRRSGIYRITTDGQGWTEVVAREGATDVVSPSDQVALRAGEMATVEGLRETRVAVARAGGYDRLERWASTLDDRRVDVDTASYVDSSLSYATRPLYGNGSWVNYQGSYAWRPYVTAGWRPYWNGYWTNTGLGMYWVANEPWGYVTHHYGTWDYLPSYGWSWFPGYRWSPAWVYWYWGSSYAGWCPTGYYTRWYGGHHGGHHGDGHHGGDGYGDGHGFHDGIYGTAGGRWNGAEHWSFVDVGHVGRHDQRDNVVTGDRIGKLPVGIITTNTSGLARQDVSRGGRAVEILRGGARGPLADVTPFVNRNETLPREVSNAVMVDVAQARAQGKPYLLADPSSEPPPAARQPARVDGGTVDRGASGSAGGSRSGGKPMPVEPRDGQPAVVDHGANGSVGGSRSGGKPMPVEPRDGGATAPQPGSAGTSDSWRKPAGVGRTPAGDDSGGSRGAGKPMPVETRDGGAASPQPGTGGTSDSWRKPAGVGRTPAGGDSGGRSSSGGTVNRGSATPTTPAKPEAPAAATQPAPAAQPAKPAPSREGGQVRPESKPAEDKAPAREKPAAEPSPSTHARAAGGVNASDNNWRQRELATVVSPAQRSGYPAVRVEADGRRTEVRSGAVDRGAAAPAPRGTAGRTPVGASASDWRARGQDARRSGSVPSTRDTQPAPIGRYLGADGGAERREVPVVRRVIEGVRGAAGSTAGRSPGVSSSPGTRYGTPAAGTRYGTPAAGTRQGTPTTSAPSTSYGGSRPSATSARPVVTSPPSSTSSSPSSGSTSGSSGSGAGSRSGGGRGSSGSGGGNGGGSGSRGGGARPHGG